MTNPKEYCMNFIMDSLAGIIVDQLQQHKVYKSSIIGPPYFKIYSRFPGNVVNATNLWEKEGKLLCLLNL